MEKIRTLRKKLTKDIDDVVPWNPSGNVESENLIIDELRENELLKVAILSAVNLSSEKKGK